MNITVFPQRLFCSVLPDVEGQQYAPLTGEILAAD